MSRFFKHFFCPPWRARRTFPKASLKAIKAAITASEGRHMGELRFVVENNLDIHQLRSGLSARQRAIEVFSQLRVWDTEHNTGVLIYLLLAERRLEIVADRGIHARVGDAAWTHICRSMETRFRDGAFEPGVLEGVEAITALLRQHFPAVADNPNEIPDAPVILP
ncbi:MAG: TPM domain-containing protein [Methylomonas sp.]|jgi:uncharacterized membrane protein